MMPIALQTKTIIFIGKMSDTIMLENESTATVSSDEPPLPFVANLSETPSSVSETARRRIKTENRDVPIETLHTWVQRGKLDTQPDFQRNFVWSPLKASR